MFPAAAEPQTWLAPPSDWGPSSGMSRDTAVPPFSEVLDRAAPSPRIAHGASQASPSGAAATSDHTFAPLAQPGTHAPHQSAQYVPAEAHGGPVAGPAADAPRQPHGQVPPLAQPLGRETLARNSRVRARRAANPRLIASSDADASAELQPLNDQTATGRVATDNADSQQAEVNAAQAGVAPVDSETPPRADTTLAAVLQLPHTTTAAESSGPGAAAAPAIQTDAVLPPLQGASSHEGVSRGADACGNAAPSMPQMDSVQTAHTEGPMSAGRRSTAGTARPGAPEGSSPGLSLQRTVTAQRPSVLAGELLHPVADKSSTSAAANESRPPAPLDLVTAERTASVSSASEYAARIDGQGTSGLPRTAPAQVPVPPIPNDVRGTLLAHPRHGPNVADLERLRLIQRVARALHAAPDQGGTLRLRLSPPELGSVQLEVILREGTMHAHLSTETATARTLLLDNLPTLRERLAELGVRLERFEIDLLNSGTAGQRQPPQEHHTSGAPVWRPRATRPEADRLPRAMARRGGSHGLDVVV